MVSSKYLSNPMDWDERIRVMEENLKDNYFNFLYFNIIVNMFDARDNADYDKEKILLNMLAAFNRGSFAGVGSLIGQLKELV